MSVIEAAARVPDLRPYMFLNPLEFQQLLLIMSADGQAMATALASDHAMDRATLMLDFLLAPQRASETGWLPAVVAAYREIRSREVTRAWLQGRASTVRSAVPPFSSDLDKSTRDEKTGVQSRGITGLWMARDVVGRMAAQDLESRLHETMERRLRMHMESRQPRTHSILGHTMPSRAPTQSRLHPRTRIQR